MGVGFEPSDRFPVQIKDHVGSDNLDRTGDGRIRAPPIDVRLQLVDGAGRVKGIG